MNPILRREMLLHQLAELMKVRASNPEKYDPQIDEICKRLPRYDVPETDGAKYTSVYERFRKDGTDQPGPHAQDRSGTGQTTIIGIDFGLDKPSWERQYEVYKDGSLRYPSWAEDH